MSVVACAQCAAPVPVDTLAAEGSYICVRVACGNFGLLHPKCFGHFIAAKQGVIPPTDTDTSEDSNAATSAPAPAVAGKSEAKGGAETDSGSSAAAGGKPKGVLLPLDAFNAMYATAPNAAGRRGRKPKPRGRPAPKKTARSGASSNTNSAVSSPRGSSRLAAKAGNSSPAVASPRARSRNPSIAKIEAYYEREKKAYLANKETVLQEWSLGPDDLWCRYCGAVDSSGFSAGPWGSKKLCTVHYVLWKQKRRLSFSEEEAATEPTKPLRLEEITSFDYRARMDIKAFKDGYVNIPALEEAKMTKAQRAEAKRKAKEALKMQKQLAELKAEAEAIRRSGNRSSRVFESEPDDSSDSDAKPSKKLPQKQKKVAKKSKGSRRIDDDSDEASAEDDESGSDENEDDGGEDYRESEDEEDQEEEDPNLLKGIDKSNIIPGGRRSRRGKKDQRDVADDKAADSSLSGRAKKKEKSTPVLDEPLIQYTRRPRKQVNYAESNSDFESEQEDSVEEEGDEGDDVLGNSDDSGDESFRRKRPSRGATSKKSERAASSSQRKRKASDRSPNGKHAQKASKSKKKKKKFRSYGSSSEEEEVEL